MTSELADYIAKNLAELKFEFNHLYLDTKDEQYPNDVWWVRFSIGDKDIVSEYRAGIGHRKPAFKIENRNGRYYSAGRTFTPAQAAASGLLTVVKPESVDVLHCLILDASGADETFDDWCSNFGYDTDSRKALDIYLKCQETRSKLIRMLGGATFHELCQLEH